MSYLLQKQLFDNIKLSTMHDGQHQILAKEKRGVMGISQDENVRHKHFFFIPDANPIKKREKLQPYSIFPLLQLPKFSYSLHQQQPTIFNETITFVPEKLNIQSVSLKEIFQNPLYTFNERSEIKNNSEFGCLKVQYSQSTIHKMSKNPENISEILSEKIQSRVELQGYAQNIDNQCQQSQEIKLQKQKSPQKISQKQQIFFQSRFESGNLCFATESTSLQSNYYLICSRDMNTSKCTQWFFFKTINKLPGKVTFHILNFVKSYSIFQNGMKICYASKSNNYKWARGCYDIKYRKTNIPIWIKKSDKFYYALSFSFTYNIPEDNVYFAYCYPYTYSMLEDFLFQKTQSCHYIKRRNIAITPGGNSVDLITITNFKQKQNQKRTIFITSRVHPGETPSSFVCEGMMRYLLGDTEEAHSLRDNFVFKFVPMLNPDGVINGSYRCSLSGYDLNRVWHRADKQSHPQIFGTRRALFETNQTDKIFFFADLHAHSKKKGIFAYGCQNKNNPYLCRQIPFLFWKNIPDFNYHQCNFMMKTGRQGTSRLYIYRQSDINYSYTIQHSFCGPLKDRIHYSAKDYNKIGVNYLLVFNKYFARNKKIEQSEVQIFQQLYTNKQLIKVGQAQEFSSSDQELDKQKAPTNFDESKIDKKIIIRRQTFRMSQRVISNQKKTVNNFRKPNFNDFEIKQQQLSTPQKKDQNFLETMRPLPVVGPQFKQKKQDKEQYQNTSNHISFKPRICFSSLTGHVKPQSVERKQAMIQTFRYDDEEEVNSLTNLFLPSLTSASYRKYNRKSSSPKNVVHVGNSLLQNAILTKQQIKGVQKKKASWKDHARSYL